MTYFAPDFTLPEGVTEVFRGVARILDVQEPDGELIRFTLSSSENWVKAQIDQSTADRCCGFIEDGVIEFVANWTEDFRLHIRSCAPVNSTIETIPIVRCPKFAHEDFRKLVSIVTGIETPPLRRFVELAMSARDQYLDLMTLPASGACHHSEEGGLLKHTVEAARLAQVVGQELFDDQASRDLAVVLAIVHDFGKLYRQPSGYRYTDVPHEELTMPAVQMGIEYLRLHAPKIADAVINGLTIGRSTKAPSSPEAIVARLSDWVSAAKDARDRAFAGKPPQFSFARVDYGKSTRTFLRIPSEPLR